MDTICSPHGVDNDNEEHDDDDDDDDAKRLRDCFSPDTTTREVFLLTEGHGNTMNNAHR